MKYLDKTNDQSKDMATITAYEQDQICWNLTRHFDDQVNAQARD